MSTYEAINNTYSEATLRSWLPLVLFIIVVG